MWAGSPSRPSAANRSTATVPGAVVRARTVTAPNEALPSRTTRSKPSASSITSRRVRTSSPSWRCRRRRRARTSAPEASRSARGALRWWWAESGAWSAPGAWSDTVVPLGSAWLGGGSGRAGVSLRRGCDAAPGGSGAVEVPEAAGRHSHRREVAVEVATAHPVHPAEGVRRKLALVDQAVQGPGRDAEVTRRCRRPQPLGRRLVGRCIVYHNVEHML